MFDRIRDRLQKAEVLLRDSAAAQADQMALIQLQKLFPEGFFFPITTWSISPVTVLHICNDISISGRKHIVEFGAGFSTLCIAALIERNALPCRFTSFESDEQWAGVMNQTLKRLGVAHAAQAVYAPIADLPEAYAHHHPQMWYSIEAVQAALSEKESVDLLLVDGPFGSVSPFARYPAVPVLKKLLAESFAIYLDDTNRPEEQQTASLWAEMLQCNTQMAERFTCLHKGRGFDPTPYGT